MEHSNTNEHRASFIEKKVSEQIPENQNPLLNFTFPIQKQQSHIQEKNLLEMEQLEIYNHFEKFF
jgi:hypothetical protein